MASPVVKKDDDDALLRCPGCRYLIGSPGSAACPECGLSLRTGYVGAWVTDSRVIFVRAALLVVAFFVLESLAMLGAPGVIHNAVTGNYQGWADLRQRFTQYFAHATVLSTAVYFVWMIACVAAAMYAGALAFQARRAAGERQAAAEGLTRRLWKKLFCLGVCVVMVKFVLMVIGSGIAAAWI